MNKQLDNTDLNLQEVAAKLSTEYAHKLADMEDAAVYGYLKGAIELLEYVGKDITRYAMIRVSNPMEYKDSGVAVSSQWRIVPIEELHNLPVYDDGE